MKEYVAALQNVIRIDLEQRAEEGVDVAALRAESALLLAGDARLSELLAFHERLLAAPIAPSSPSWPYQEPADWDGILASRSDGAQKSAPAPLAPDLYDRIYGGWLGRCAGCLLGKPVEGIRRAGSDDHPGHWQYIRRFLAEAGAYPLHGYIPFVPAEQRSFRLHGSWPTATAGHITGMPRDDDIDYAILNLIILESFGREWTPEQALGEWLRRLPAWHIYAAGRAAYANTLAGMPAERAALVGNAYRQSLGGMIRADMWGWTCPGRPAQAAYLAYRDSILSQTSNGVYAGMFWAAAVALAFTVDSPRAIIEAALSQIPPLSRLAEAVCLLLDLQRGEPHWEQAVEAIYERYGHLPFNHSIPNTCIAVMGLLYGGGDFGQSIERTVMGGFDTDCTGATVGSIMGVLLGAQALPEAWIAPLQDRVSSSVAKVGTVRISSLAERTVALAAGAC